MSRASLKASLTVYFPDNITEEISPLDQRTVFENFADEVLFKAEDSYLRIGATTNSGNTYALSLTDQYPTAYSALVPILVKVNATNTGAATLNINALGAKSWRDVNGVALASGALVEDTYYLIVFDAANDWFITLLSGSGSSYSGWAEITGTGTVEITAPQTYQLIKSGVTQVNVPATLVDGYEKVLKNVSGGNVTLNGNGTNIYTSSSNATRVIANGATFKIKYDANDDLLYNFT